MLNVKWEWHGRNSNGVGIRGPRSTIPDSLRHSGKVGGPMPVLGGSVILSPWFICWTALRFRERNGCESVLQTSKHLWKQRPIPRISDSNIQSLTHELTGSQIQVHSEQFCARGWRKPYKIPLEMVYQQLWNWRLNIVPVLGSFHVFTSQESNSLLRDFSGGPVAKTLHSQCQGPRFNPWSGN